jgi:hypothetical protein
MLAAVVVHLVHATANGAIVDNKPIGHELVYILNIFDAIDRLVYGVFVYDRDSSPRRSCPKE